MFNFREFIMDAICGMIGNAPDYKVRQYAAGWYDKGVVYDADMAEIKERIVKKNEAMQNDAETLADIGGM